MNAVHVSVWAWVHACKATESLPPQGGHDRGASLRTHTSSHVYTDQYANSIIILYTRRCYKHVGTGMCTQSCTRCYLFDHFFKLLFLVVPELLVVLHGGDVETILGLGFGWLKWTCKNGHLGITHFLWGYDRIDRYTIIQIREQL